MLLALPPAEASRILQQSLQTGLDADSRLPFRVGPNGFLRSPSSWRVFLLDVLGQVDPAAAAAYAETVLAGRSSADEWAVALRNVALGNPQSAAQSILKDKFREMISYAPWLDPPSTGFLESFDVAVHLGGATLVPDLTGLVRNTNNPAVAHAAYLALDRLTLKNPNLVLEHLLNHPDAMIGREQTRANYFARADVRDPSQRQILERYLSRETLSSTELDTFAGLYPNANYMVSHNLLTSTRTPTGAEILDRDRQALAVVSEWMENPSFAPRIPHLRRIQERLKQFTQSSRPSNPDRL
jgi:hypothetical protein